MRFCLKSERGTTVDGRTDYSTYTHRPERCVCIGAPENWLRSNAHDTTARRSFLRTLLPRRPPGQQREWSTGATTPADTARRGRTGRQLQRREDRSGSARPPDTRTRRRRPGPPYRPPSLPCDCSLHRPTWRRSALRSSVHPCMHPAGHVRSPNTIIRLIRHRRQEACYALPAPCTQAHETR
jgi:hypothetical protein